MRQTFIYTLFPKFNIIVAGNGSYKQNEYASNFDFSVVRYKKKNILMKVKILLLNLYSDEFALKNYSHSIVF